jgi:hypothetical protein
VQAAGLKGKGLINKASLFALLLLASSRVLAGSEVDLPGILINETRTASGHLFYTEFSANWLNYDPDGVYSLTVMERPSVITASQVTVKFAGRPVFQRFISTKPDEIRKLARTAAQAASRQVGVMNGDVQNIMARLFPDPDMAPDEINLN